MGLPTAVGVKRYIHRTARTRSQRRSAVVGLGKIAGHAHACQRKAGIAVLVRVTVSGWTGGVQNLTAEGQRRRRDGAGRRRGTAPVPDNATCCGLAAALSVKVMAPVSVPVAVGVKVTEMVQLAPAGRLEGQALVSAKLPEAAMPLIESESVPEFFKVTV